MSHGDDTRARRVLILLKFDMENLYEKVVERFDDYIEIFSMKRTRSHFVEVFKSRYDGVPISDLALASEDIIIALNEFYKRIDDLHWYFLSTEDLPATVEDYVRGEIKKIKPSYSMLKLYLEAELDHLNKESA